MIERKYYSINEVSEVTGLSLSKLRYAERIVPAFNIRKIRGRRYYTKRNIEQLAKAHRLEMSSISVFEKNSYSPDYITSPTSYTAPESVASNNNQLNILEKIDILSTKLSNLSTHIVV